MATGRRPSTATLDSDPAALADELCALGRAAGLDAVGIAGAHPFDRARRALEERKAAGLHGGMHFTYGNPVRATDPSRSVPGAQALVVGARAYRRAPAGERPPNAAAVAAYSWRDHYAPLRDALAVVADRLRADGWQAKVLVDDNALVDREAAYRAGIGWFGKNANLLIPGAGSWFVLGSVVTDAPLPADAADAPVADGCGTCTRCMPACPTGALVAPGVLDARRCLAWLLEAPGDFPVEHRAALGGRIYGCDECQEACPPNRAADRHHPPPPAEPDAEPWVDLVDLLDNDDGTLLARFGRWYVPRRDPRYLRRNALVALGNVGDPADPGVRRVVHAARTGDDPMLREHADWAAAHLGL
ncbi:MAG TPA: tRNA epoxyqueuosine(34) reductase QueG [Acidimicrobiales bacterium]|nr:tRNA epoxyqueuosine(34) reductase QueG [Acidimicrobiales bacterium]